MRNPHEPNDAFIAKLEVTVAEEFRRRRTAQPFRWMPTTRLGLAVAVAVLVAVSMTIGGATVVAAYQAQARAQRDIVLMAYEQRLGLAAQRLTLAQEDLKTSSARMQVGLGTPEESAEAESKMAKAQVDLDLAKLDLEEVRQTGVEPQNTVSAPFVVRRDFVTERWMLAMRVPEKALELEKLRLQGAQRRFNVGIATAFDVEEPRSRIVELQATIDMYRRKLEVRQIFLRKEADAARADLLILEAETTQHRATVTAQLELAKKQLDQLTPRGNSGTTVQWRRAGDERTEINARLRVIELNLELTKVDYELQLIKLKLAGK